MSPNRSYKETLDQVDAFTHQSRSLGSTSGKERPELSIRHVQERELVLSFTASWRTDLQEYSFGWL